MPDSSKKRDEIDARKFMEKAIEMMRQSIHEPRQDGKISPDVGAVLLKQDGSVETASRGELRYGDHAEFTLLERKNRSNKLDGSILFATLEPCAPDSRHPPKMSCAERIVLARIKEGWVGVADLDPKVDRKGIKYLQDAGIDVHMFDRDLQEIIHKENESFFAQALERAEESKKKVGEEILLSALEGACDTTVTEDLSDEALMQYQSLANIESEISSEDFHRRLTQQGLLKKEDGQLTPTGFGILLFGKEPRVTMPQAAMLATIHYPDGTEETKDFDGPMVLIPELMEKWLHEKLPNVIDRNAMQRKVIPPLPFEMIREAVVNALIHRDYDIREAKCQLIVTANTITIKSPGSPLSPITLEQLQKFNAPMLSRNPGLHYVFAQMHMAEERGLGISSLKKRAEEIGLPIPKYSYEVPYLVLTLYRNLEGAADELLETIAMKLNADENAAWQFILTKESVTSRELIESMKFDERKAQRVLKKLIDAGLLERIGKGPATRYKVI